MAASSRLSALINALRCLPGVGRKSAQRMSYHLLQRDRDGGRRLAQSLLDAMEHVGHCRRCRNFSELEVCAVCADPRRARAELCVVESPADVQAMEEAGFKGVYFVLMGRLSPLDGIGPEELGLDKLDGLISDGGGDGGLREIILATNSTVEGEATAHYIGEMVKKRGLKISRIAHGVPLGGELEYIDSGTLSRALAERREWGESV